MSKLKSMSSEPQKEKEKGAEVVFKKRAPKTSKLVKDIKRGKQ